MKDFSLNLCKVYVVNNLDNPGWVVATWLQTTSDKLIITQSRKWHRVSMIEHTEFPVN